METMLVTFGVSLAKKGILTASLTQRQIFLTNSGSLKEININSLVRFRDDILFGLGVWGVGSGVKLMMKVKMFNNFSKRIQLRSVDFVL